ncbi:MAG TPA: regulatory protein RecX [Terriglobales bacterium]|nr:regulatory protein RecX [Terriglobales bacterium]
MDDAFHAATAFLRRRDRSTAEVRQHLQEHGCAAEDIDAAVCRLIELRYLDDGRFALSVAERLAQRGHGPLRAQRDLARAGVPAEVIAATIAEVFVDPVALARRVCAARFPHLDDDRQRARAARFLAGRGFPHHLIENVLGGVER